MLALSKQGNTNVDLELFTFFIKVGMDNKLLNLSLEILFTVALIHIFIEQFPVL